MANLLNRVEKLEQATGGDDEYCQCRASSYDVRWADDSEDAAAIEPESCERCGKPRRVMVISWLGQDAPDTGPIGDVWPEVSDGEGPEDDDEQAAS